MTDECKISVEIKAVNHRYLDLGIKMPKKFNYFEASMRTLLKDYIQRGKVDIFVTYEDYTDAKVFLKYNKSLAQEYMDSLDVYKRQKLYTDQASEEDDQPPCGSGAYDVLHSDGRCSPYGCPCIWL